MILWLFALLIALSLVMVVIGLWNSDESAYAVIGFTFLFYLAVIMIGGNVVYATGQNVTTEFSYITLLNQSEINSTSTVSSINYTAFDDGYSQWFGRFLAMGSVAGFVGVFVGLRGKKKKPGEFDNEERTV